MNAPDTCPRCGADSVMQSSGSYFRCGTWATSDGTVDQSRDCTSAQRDALAARVKELEAYAERLIGAGDRSADLLSCSMGLDETDEWANTHGAHKTRIASDAISDWEKAKETKP